MIELFFILFISGGILLCIGVYFVPFIIAMCRNHNITGIFLINFFAGWTLIGWIIALAMACTDTKPQQQLVYVKETALPVNAEKEEKQDE